MEFPSFWPSFKHSPPQALLSGVLSGEHGILLHTALGENASSPFTFPLQGQGLGVNRGSSCPRSLSWLPVCCLATVSLSTRENETVMHASSHYTKWKDCPSLSKRSHREQAGEDPVPMSAASSTSSPLGRTECGELRPISD